MEEEEEMKFDFQTLLAESSKKFNRKGMKFNPLGFGRKGLTGGLGFKPTASSSSLNSAVKGKTKDG
jgi:hypothetical protein